MSDAELRRLERERLDNPDSMALERATCRAEGHEWGEPTLWNTSGSARPGQRAEPTCRLLERACRRCGEGDYRHGPWAYSWERPGGLIVGVDPASVESESPGMMTFRTNWDQEPAFGPIDFVRRDDL